MIDEMKDLEFKLQEKRNWLHGQVNAVDEVLVPEKKTCCWGGGWRFCRFG